MSKEIKQGFRYGEGEIIAICDNCGKESTAQVFGDGCKASFKEAQENLTAYGWIAWGLNNVRNDFCSEKCRDEYVAELEAKGGRE